MMDVWTWEARFKAASKGGRGGCLCPQIQHCGTCGSVAWLGYLEISDMTGGMQFIGGQALLCSNLNLIFCSTALGGNNFSQALSVNLNKVSTLLHW